MNLIYFSDISQLDYVLTEQPELLKTMRPITGDMAVSFELERLSIDYIDEWDLINSTEIEKNWNEAYTLSKSWWDERLASTHYGIEALTVSAQQDMVYPFQACLNARTLYSRLLNTYSIEKICGFFLTPIAVIRTGPAPTSRVVRSVSEAVLIYIAEKRGIPLVKLNSYYELSKGKADTNSKDLGNNWAAVNNCAFKNTTKKRIFIYKDGLRPSEFDVIIKTIGSLNDVTPIVISQHDLENGAQLKGSRLDINLRLNSFWKIFTANIESYSGEYPEIFSNPHLNFQFKRIRNEMEMAANYGDVFASLVDMWKPSMIIFGFESFTIERVLVSLAQSKGVFVLGMLHGGVMPIMAMRGVAGRADVITVWNKFDIANIKAFGIEQSRILNIGCIQYENSYIKYINNIPSKLEYISKQNLKRRLWINADKPLIMLVTAEINTGLAAPLANPSKHRDALRQLLTMIHSRQDLQFVIKPHPSFDYYELYRRMLNNSKLNNLKFLEDITLGEVIEASDICIMINYCTTASLEAMLHRLPVIYMNNAVYPIDNWQDNLSNEGINRVKSIFELEKNIDLLLHNQTTKVLALSKADKQIREILGVEARAASIRFADFVDGVFENSNLYKEQNLFNLKDYLDYPSSKNLTILNFYRQLTKNHSSDLLMFSLTYSAGACSLGYSSIIRIFKLCQNEAKNIKLKDWKTAKWELIPIYINGHLSINCYDTFKFSQLNLIIPYLLQPSKFIYMPNYNKKKLTIFLLICIFREKALPILKAAYNFTKLRLNII